MCRSSSQSCTELTSEMYTVLAGMATPDMVAMSSGSRPDWAAVLTEDCPEPQAVSSMITLSLAVWQYFVLILTTHSIQDGLGIHAQYFTAKPWAIGCMFMWPCSMFNTRLILHLRRFVTGYMFYHIKRHMLIISFGCFAATIIVSSAFQEDSCVTGCFVPHSLSIQFLWTKRGLLSLPQNYILGAKYQFACQKVKVWPLPVILLLLRHFTGSFIAAQFFWAHHWFVVDHQVPDIEMKSEM